METQIARKDLAVYQSAVRAATGALWDWQESVPDEAFDAYVERGTARYLDGAGQTSLPVSFNYERWVGGSGQRA